MDRGGAIAGAAGLALLSGQRTILGVAITWCVAQAGLNCMQAGVTALVPDRVPVTQRGAVSGWSGLSQTIGVVLAVVLVSDLITGRVPAYLALGILVMAAAIPILRAPDPQVPRDELPVFEARAVVRAFRFSPRRYPDFSWAWATRFLVQLGNSMTILYLLYFLRDRVRYQQLFPGRKAEQGLLILIVIYTLATVTTVVIGGVISDRSGRRKPAVMFAGYTMAAAAVLLAAWPVWTGAIIAAAVLGLGYGVYASVDQALVTQVLPTDADRAKDLGIINIANSAPQVLAPALAAPIVTYLGGYPVLFGAVAAVTVAGGLRHENPIGALNGAGPRPFPAQTANGPARGRGRAVRWSSARSSFAPRCPGSNSRAWCRRTTTSRRTSRSASGPGPRRGSRGASSSVRPPPRAST